MLDFREIGNLFSRINCLGALQKYGQGTLIPLVLCNLAYVQPSHSVAYLFDFTQDSENRQKWIEVLLLFVFLK